MKLQGLRVVDLSLFLPGPLLSEFDQLQSKGIVKGV